VEARLVARESAREWPMVPAAVAIWSIGHRSLDRPDRARWACRPGRQSRTLWVVDRYPPRRAGAAEGRTSDGRLSGPSSTRNRHRQNGAARRV
jgi:hypothetical protein